MRKVKIFAIVLLILLAVLFVSRGVFKRVQAQATPMDFSEVHDGLFVSSFGHVDPPEGVYP
jgi:hypothetical protein